MAWTPPAGGLDPANGVAVFGSEPAQGNAQRAKLMFLTGQPSTREACAHATPLSRPKSPYTRQAVCAHAMLLHVACFVLRIARISHTLSSSSKL